ncbi:MAG: hypothetical protein S4CHLAM45_10810 [Chlamydiales bacterium]|nr:hypothetical protein [Chlamydiales bacterium]MCH9619573.1 hypothetical protein [Chlamydiales bacterium]MCH9623179.1 hypothetical protein [Chlamydiales bacterium]
MASSIESLFDETLIQIFQKLDEKSLKRCTCVCKRWQSIIHQYHLWHLLLLKQHRFDVIDIFSPLIEVEKIGWREAFRFASVTSLFQQIIGPFVSTPEFIIGKNPSFKEVRFPGLYMPKIYVSYGASHFTITDSTNVSFERGGEIKILQGEKRFTHLSVEGAFLFALRLDGMVIQWNYQAGKIVREIATSKRGKIPQEALCAYGGECAFAVEGGFLILWNEEKQVLEVISYSNPEDRFEIGAPHYNSSQQKVLVKGGKLFVPSEKKVNVWDLQTHKLDASFDLPIEGGYFKFWVDQELLYVLQKHSQIIIKLIDKEIILNRTSMYDEAGSEFIVGVEGDFILAQSDTIHIYTADKKISFPKTYDHSTHSIKLEVLEGMLSTLTPFCGKADHNHVGKQ